MTAKEKARQRARDYYNARKHDPAFQERNRQRARNHKLAHPEIAQEWKKKNRSKIAATQRAWEVANRDDLLLKTRIRTQANFDKIKQQRRDWRKKRAEHVKAYGAQRHLENREQILVKQKAWREDNKERHLATVKAWAEANRDRVKANDKAWRERNAGRVAELKKRARAKAKLDPGFQILDTLRSRMKEIVRKGAMIKRQTSLSLIGCTPLALRQHLERQFKPGMSWDNRREWHIDHIRPCYTFDLHDLAEQRACFHYTNLRPLWASENLGRLRPNQKKRTQAAACA